MATSGYASLVRKLRKLSADTPLSIYYVNLGGMRTVNRVASSEAADELIERALNAMSTWVGPEGICGRLWSDEFVAVKPVDHPQEAAAESMSLRRTITTLTYTGSHGEGHLDLSIGVACARAPFNWPQLISQANDACEIARGRGVNQIHFFRTGDPALPTPPTENNAISRFRKLRDGGKISLHPQPIMAIRACEPYIAKAEFLMRIEQDGGFIPPPYGMIKDLEENGHSTELDRFTSRLMIDWMEDNGDLLEKLDGVSFNLSAPSFTDGIFMSDLYSDLRHAKMRKNKLSLEITETAAIKNLTVAAEVIAEFRQLGIRFSLDDFGSGLCSFGYLQSLKVDEVKIDGQFIRELPSSQVNQEIVRAIHQVAHATGKTTVAEFVDEPSKLRILKEIGLNYAQGWLFYKSVTPDVFRSLVQQQAHREAAASF